MVIGRTFLIESNRANKVGYLDSSPHAIKESDVLIFFPLSSVSLSPLFLSLSPVSPLFLSLSPLSLLCFSFPSVSVPP
jgi:hypothetical protein